MVKIIDIKIALLVAFIVAVCLLSSCAARSAAPGTAFASPSPTTVSPDASSSPAPEAANTLSTHIFSEDEKKLMNLLLMNAAVSIYDFNVGEDIKHVKVWYEQYGDGKLVRADTPLTGDIDKYNRTGSIAVVLGDGESLRLSLKYASGAVQRVENLPEGTKENSTVQWTDTEVQSWTTGIAPDKDIAFLIYIGNTADRLFEFQGVSTLDSDETVQSQYKYAYIFKCRFTTD